VRLEQPNTKTLKSKKTKKKTSKNMLFNYLANHNRTKGKTLRYLCADTARAKRPDGAAAAV
jgi:hypothetical protein